MTRTITTVTPEELRAEVGSGLLCFPVTHANPDLSLDEAGFRQHLEYLAQHRPAGVFVAGGTGEFFALRLAEVKALVSAGVGAVQNVPVIAPAGYGTATAVEMAREGTEAGADGVFLLPPYLTEVDQEGLKAHVRAVCRSTPLGVIVYHRANARFEPQTVIELADELPNLVGFKDGVGDLDTLTTLQATLGPRLVYIGGLPTAETYALPYLEVGVTTYSSAIFNFAPQWAQMFYDAVVNRRRDQVTEQIRDFVLPYIEIRNRRAGYAVSIVKAGLRAVGRPAGPVRPPLVDLTSHEVELLASLVAPLGCIQ